LQVQALKILASPKKTHLISLLLYIIYLNKIIPILSYVNCTFNSLIFFSKKTITIPEIKSGKKVKINENKTIKREEISHRKKSKKTNLPQQTPK